MSSHMALWLTPRSMPPETLAYASVLTGQTDYHVPVPSVSERWSETPVWSVVR